VISLRQVTLRRGAKVVLEGAGLALHAGEKVGLVGRNGAGKSTLFALLGGRLAADVGDFERPPRWRFAEVAQEMPETAMGATDFVLEGDDLLVAANAALAAAEAGGDGHAIAEAHATLDEAGAFDARARAESMLLGLGFTSAELDRPVNAFSGGWRMRLQLARALMCPADVLLLDEPTNHLDLDALVWLEAWLLRFPGLIVVISHDREFLDAVTKVTVHVDEGRLVRYGGNYSAFEATRAERLVLAQAAFERQQQRIAHLQSFIDRFKAKATKARQAQSRVKALARMEKLAPVLAAAEFQIEFREPRSLPDPMLTLEALAAGYGEAVIVRGVERFVRAGERIGILGANGQGKSTLVKTIAGVLPPIAGRVIGGKGLAIGYFAQQELDVLRPEEGPLAHFVRLARETAAPAAEAREQALRDFLGRFRFGGEMVAQPVGTLSGGEKARLVLAMLVWQRPNLLLLDEPTNHLDLDTREALSVALNEFEGTVMLVSHDRAMLREVCDEFWLVTRGGVRPFDGDLDDYQRWLLDVSRAVARGQPPPEPPKLAPPAPEAKSSDPRPEPRTATARPEARPSATATSGRDARQAAKQDRAAQSARTRPLRMEAQRIEARLAALEAERAECEAAMAAPAASDFAELGRRLAHVQAETAMLEERWLEVQGELEALAR
jgi:ATP-binding cassette subfamily F protein 3